MPKDNFTRLETARLISYRLLGIEWDVIAKRFPGRSVNQCRYRFFNARKHDERKGETAAWRLRMPPELDLERAERDAARARQSLTGAVFGDPPPGYSALDLKARP